MAAGSAALVLIVSVVGFERRPELLTAVARDQARRELQAVARAEERSVAASGSYRLSGSAGGVAILRRGLPSAATHTVRVVAETGGVEVGTRANGAWLCVLVSATSSAAVRCSPAVAKAAR